MRASVYVPSKCATPSHKTSLLTVRGVTPLAEYARLSLTFRGATIQGKFDRSPPSAAVKVREIVTNMGIYMVLVKPANHRATAPLFPSLGLLWQPRG